MYLLKGKYLFIILGLLAFWPVSGQVVINEVVSSNSVLFDEDGDTPDWLEIYNPGTESIDLTGWTLTDDILDPSKWIFPEISIGPGEYLVIWASGKDRLTIGYVRTLITQGDEYRYLVPTQNVDPAWMAPGFDDASWSLGNSGFGYGDGDDATTIPLGSPSVMARAKFNIQDVNSVGELVLDIDYDDSFVAYINGVEIARSNVYGNPPAWNTLANAGREATLYQGWGIERYIITNATSILNSGENTFAVEAHNVSTGSSDMSLIPYVSLVFTDPTTDGIEPPAELQLVDQYLHSSFSISGAGESLYLYNNLGTEIDQVQLPSLPADYSYGLTQVPDTYALYEVPTPGAPNIGTTFSGQVTNKVIFSDPGGVTTVNEVILSGADVGEEIRYTLDATEPDANSTLYTGPINTSSTTTIRAAIFRDGYVPSKSEARTYLKVNSHSLPVVSLVTDPANFFDPVDGIYVLGQDYQGGDFPYFGSNIWEDWERPIHFSLYESDGTLSTTFNAGVKIFGGWSRAQIQKSLSIFARGRYGDSEINHQLFPDYPYSSFQAIVLRNSGNDFLNSNIRDGVLTSLMKSADLEIQAFRPTVTYLNGIYWGVYNMREKVNEHFIASKAGVNPEDVDLLETSANAIQGSNQGYVDLINFIQQNPVNLNENYEYVSSRIDIDNYITYLVAQIYFDNTDWPGNNIKYWKAGNGKWRWILYDTDFGFGIWNVNNFNHNTLAFALEPNGPGWPNPPWSTYLFRSLVTNRMFRNRFINLFADNLNSRFLPTNVLAHIDSIANMVRPEMSRHYQVHGSDVQNHFNNVNNMKTFAANRPQPMKNYIRDMFNLGGIYRVTLLNDNPDYGYVKLNSLALREASWSGDYFRNVPITLTAVPDPGYTFTHWSGDINSTNPQIDINLTSATNITAHFIEGPVEGLPLVINEINYNPSAERDSEDWVELYNPNTNFMDIGGYEIRDNDDTHQYFIPAGTIIDGRGFLVVARSLADFEFQYPSVDNVIGELGFGLSSAGDAVRLYDPLGVQQDAVYYQPSSPWPPEANGQGWTLELENPFLDNQDPQNWAAINFNGSPGRQNSVVSSIDDKLEDQIQVYPNPFQDKLEINFNNLSSHDVRISLYNLQGSLVLSASEAQLKGQGDIRLDTSGLQRGIYILRIIEASGQAFSLRLVKEF